MSQRSEKALELFKGGHFCSQAVLLAFSDDLGLDSQTALKITSGFGGGMGRMGEVCGAVTGAFMVLGYHDWQASTVSMDEKNKVSTRVRDFAKRFQQKHGSIVCRDLMGCDIGQAHGYQEAIDKGLFVSICRPAVEDAAKILEDMLNES